MVCSPYVRVMIGHHVWQCAGRLGEVTVFRGRADERAPKDLPAPAMDCIPQSTSVAGFVKCQ